MNDAVKCLVCGKKFKSIGWKHLRSHGLTTEDYKQKFPGCEMRSPASMLRKQAAAKRANSHRKGKPRSAEVRLKISNTKKAAGRPAWNKGIPLTEEQKHHLSEKRKALYASGDIIHWNTGNTTPMSTRQKISQTAKNQHRTQSPESKRKRAITMLSKRLGGWIPPSHRADVIGKRKSTTMKRLGVEHYMQYHIPPEVLGKLNDRDWLFDQHITQQKPITKICTDLGLHWKNSNGMVKSRLLKFGIDQQYYFSSSYPENEISNILTSWNISHIKNTRKVISPKELDIYIPGRKIAIEYCGLYWHTTKYLNKNYHKDKMLACAEQGVRLITIFEDEWLYRKDIVVAKLKNILGEERRRVYARHCGVREVDTTTKQQFLEKYHIQGAGNSSVSLGLFYHNRLVALQTFKKLAHGEYELNRFATTFPVIGGFSKILTHFVNEHNPKKIVSFADLRWSLGDVYEKNGFVLDSVINPDYSYVDIVNTKRIHKFNFRHATLPTVLDYYDPTLSETQNCDNNGWSRIYNCGLLRFVKKYN